MKSNQQLAGLAAILAAVTAARGGVSLDELLSGAEGCTCGQCGKGEEDNRAGLIDLSKTLIDKYTGRLVEDLTKDIPSITADCIISGEGAIATDVIQVKALVQLPLPRVLQNANGLTPEQPPLEISVVYTLTKQEQDAISSLRKPK